MAPRKMRREEAQHEQGEHYWSGPVDCGGCCTSLTCTSLADFWPARIRGTATHRRSRSQPQSETNKQQTAQRARTQTNARETDRHKTTHQEKGQTSEKAESQSAPQGARHISATPNNRPQIPPVDIRLKSGDCGRPVCGIPLRLVIKWQRAAPQPSHPVRPPPTRRFRLSGLCVPVHPSRSSVFRLPSSVSPVFPVTLGPKRCSVNVKNCILIPRVTR